MRFYTAEDLEEERRKGISTNLSLSYRYNTKRLKESDLGNLSRLLVPSNLVKKDVLPLLSSDLVNGIKSKRGAPAVFWDVDTETTHNLVFKKWDSSGSYVFIGGWTTEFVQRRSLKEGDEIRIYWDVPNSRFNFSVIYGAR
ncbi:B3 domain-containing protein At2g33720-like [Jatropha curcas]|uniref:B3 domain-containing protein At2g33720-like n=1 Tax=Jatropha curcas TaxID=180498 RepID=UPI00189399CB|nr:B3 domain-containing protein At2g33720-like [Jatropha curcas]